jgi:energy-coupling factor transport system substrate-specific component
LKGRDFINIAIFGLLFVLIHFMVAIPSGLVVFLYPFSVALASIPCGIVWAYLRAKVAKRFAILLQGVILALLTLVLGSGWFVAVSVLAGSILAELIAGIGKYKSFKLNILGYAVFAVALHLGLFAIILLAKDYYLEFCLASGMDPAYMDMLINFVTGPILLISTALAAAGATIGMLLGRVFLKKHFERAGIV